MQKIIKSSLFILLLVSISYQLDAQANAPYSRFGLGDLRTGNFSSNRGMGGIAAGYSGTLNINFTNPASYSDLFLTTFEVGANFDGLSIKGTDSVYSTGNGSLSHFAFGFPIQQGKWGMSFGLLPFSHVNYNFIVNRNEPGVGRSDLLFQGSGTLYDLYLGSGYKVGKFSFGLNAIVKFGKLEYIKNVTFPDSSNSLNTRNISSLSFKDFSLNAGLQYRTQLGNPLKNQERTPTTLTLGIYGAPTINLDVFVNNLWERYDFSIFGPEIPYVRDTLGEPVFEAYDQVRLPGHVGIGFALNKSSGWLIGADLKYSFWSDFESPLSNDNLNNSWRFSLGAQLIPEYLNEDPNHNYLSRMEYRLGGYLGSSEIVVENEQLTEYGITFGLGLPVKSEPKRSLFAKINMNLDIGSRGKSNTTFIRETHYRFTTSFILNDKWFSKRKFD